MRLHIYYLLLCYYLYHIKTTSFKNSPLGILLNYNIWKVSGGGEIDVGWTLRTRQQTIDMEGGVALLEYKEEPLGKQQPDLHPEADQVEWKPGNSMNMNEGNGGCAWKGSLEKHRVGI